MLANILVIDRALSIIFIILVIFFDKKKPESSLAWILVLTFLPYLGVTLYILFADSFRFRIHKKETEKLTKNKELQKEIRSQLNALNSIDKNKHINSAISLATLNINADNLITSNNKLCVYNKGIDMFVDLLEDIANAKKFIHISYYIIQKDKYGERLKNALIRKLKDGVELDGEIVKPSRVKLKKVDPKSNSCMVQITIHEGKNHQVKRMFESVGFPVAKLKREKEAFFDLKDLQSGEFRKLTPKEVAKVYGLKQK